MNIVFYFLSAIVLTVIYFILSILFGVIGNISYRLYKKFKNNIIGEDEND